MLSCLRWTYAFNCIHLNELVLSSITDILSFCIKQTCREFIFLYIHTKAAKKKMTRLITYLYLPLEGAQVTPWVPVTEFKNSCFKALENSIINCRVEKKQRDFQNILHCTSLFLSLKKKNISWPLWQVMFENYQFSGVYIAIQAVLTLYAQGKNAFSTKYSLIFHIISLSLKMNGTIIWKVIKY